ncbi:unnamed protein product [Ambrosiozyma monospora]|uniref:Unnamed protein product n=1 Tax=Ambrosiozyma monospora TaxID=43982 RepID=A0ACB5SUP0_AMBMO|nr:unnamed protein product [Ambrosiozyma monospora]
MTEVTTFRDNDNSPSYYGGKVAGMRFPSSFITEHVTFNPIKMLIWPDSVSNASAPIIRTVQMAFSRPRWLGCEMNRAYQYEISSKYSKIPFFLVYVDANLPKVVDIDPNFPMATSYHGSYYSIHRCPLEGRLFKILYVPFEPSNREDFSDDWLSYQSTNSRNL